MGSGDIQSGLSIQNISGNSKKGILNLNIDGSLTIEFENRLNGRELFGRDTGKEDTVELRDP